MNLMDFSLIQNLLSINIFIIGLLICIFIGNNLKLTLIHSIFLYIWHSIFSVSYFLYVVANRGDAIKYYLDSLEGVGSFYPGSPFVKLITSIFSVHFDASFFVCFTVFNIIGAIGLLFLAALIKDYNYCFSQRMKFLTTILPFIPSLSFWTSAIGKDGLAFLATMTFIYSSIKGKNLFLFSIFLMGMVRPHVAAFMLISTIIYYIFSSNLAIWIRLLFIPFFIGIFVITMPFITKYVGLEENNADSITDYVEKRQELNLSGGSSVDIANMSYPEQMFTYVFRPLPYEVNSLFSFITSLDNLILLCTVFIIIFKLKKSYKYLLAEKNLLLMVYVLITWSVFAMTTANLGIAVRQKWMFVPALLIILISAYHFSLKKLNTYKE